MDAMGDASDSWTPSSSSSTGEAENIAVCIRVRPLSEREVRNRDVNVLRAITAMNIISITDADGAPLGGKHNVFQYDHIYDQQSSTQHMYDQVAKRIVRSTLDGINGTIFAYGQTSSGKTYTMQGGQPFEPEQSPNSPGILQLAVEDIFNYIENCDDRDFLLRVSFVEIYNEVVKDLLNPSEKGNNLKLREDPRKGVYVECKEEIITNYENILQLLEQGNLRRTVGQTAMNERSSRSHSIFRIVIESKQKSMSRRQSEDDVNGAVLVACLSLVDLAGSESVRNTAAEGIRQREAGNINKSLLTLSRVINSLASSSSGGQNAPFRDSKLTRLLQNSLDGNTRTLIICCVTPSDRYLDETKSTLQFAARAKTIQTSASVNEVLDDQAQLKRLKREVHELKKLVNNEAYNALKAENEALMHEKSLHKEEYARLMGLILTSGTTRTRPSSDSKVNQRTKRSRETWCPGDFPVSVTSLRNSGEHCASVFASPNPQPRKRQDTDSGSKENIVPQNLLSALEDEMDDNDDDGNEGSNGSHRLQLLSSTLLQVFELALQEYRGENDEVHDRLNTAMEQMQNLVPGEEDFERLSELLQELKYMVELGGESEKLRGANELLNMENEELRHRSSLVANRSNLLERSNEDVDMLRAELAEAQKCLERERKLVAEISKEKEALEKLVAENSEEYVQQIESLRIEIDEKQAMFDAELQDLQSALVKKTEQVEQLHSENDASDILATTTQKVEALQQQYELAQQEIAKLKEAEHKILKAHENVVLELETSSKSTIDELSQQLESAFVEVEEQKLLRSEEVSRLEKQLQAQAVEFEEKLTAWKDRETDSSEEASLDGDGEKEALREERNALEGMLQEMEEARTRLQSRVDHLESELSSIKASRDREAEPELAETQRELTESLKTENEHLLSERANLTDAMMALEEQLQQTAKYHSDLDAQVKHLIEEKSALVEKVTTLEAELEKLGDRTNSEMESPDQEPSLQQMSPEISEGDGKLAVELQNLLQDMTKLQFELEQVTTEKREFANTTEQLKQELETVKADGVGKQATFDKEKQAYKEELERLRTDLQYAANEKQASDINIQDLNEERALLAESIQAVKHEMDQLLLKTSNKAERLEIEVMDLRAAKKKLEGEASALTLSLQAAQEEKATLVQKKQEYDEDKESLLATIASLEMLESKLQELLSEKENHANQVTTLESKLVSVSAENIHLQEKIQVLSSEKLTWLQKSASSEDLQQEITATKEEQSRLALLVEELETRLAHKSHDSDHNQSQVAKLVAEIAEYETTVAEQATAIEQLSTELLENDEERNVLQARIDELTLAEDRVAEQDEVIVQLKTLNEEYASKVFVLEEAKSEMEMALEQLNGMQPKLGGESVNSAQFEELRAKITALEEEKKKLASELDRSSSERSDLIEELSALESQLMEESQEKLRLTAASEELEKKLREMKSKQKSTSDGGDANEDVDSLQQRLEIEAELRATLELDVKSYEDTLAVLRSELKDSSDTISDLLEKLKTMEFEVESIKQAKERAEKDTEVAQELMQRAKEEQEELRFQNQQRVLSSEGKDLALHDTIEALKQELKDAKQELESKQKELDGQIHQRLQSSEANDTALQMTISDLERELIDTRKLLAVQEDEWKMKLLDAEKQVGQMNDELDQKRDELARLEEVGASAQSELCKLSEELAHAQQTYTELLQSKEEVEKQLNENDSKWRAKEEELSQKISNELLSLKRAYTEIAQQKEELEHQLIEIDAQWRAKEQALGQKASAEMDSLREQYQEAQEELDSYQKYADDEIHKLRSSIAATEVEIEETNRASQAKQEELNDRIKEQEEWMVRLKTKHEELETENVELYAERKALTEKLEKMESSHDVVTDQLQSELRDMSIKCEQVEARFTEATENAKELKLAMEKLEGEAYQHRNDLEDMSESLKSVQMEAMHYQKQLVSAQTGKDELEKIVETQKKRIDKLEKVKMTTETLDLFRKLKKDREELQIKVQELQNELAATERSKIRSKEAFEQQHTRLIQQKDEELEMFKQQVEDLEETVKAEKERSAQIKAEWKSSVRDVLEKSQQEISDMQDLLREKADQVESLEQRVETLEKENVDIMEQKSGKVTYLEQENLELLVENRKLKKRLESQPLGRAASSVLADLSVYDESATAKTSTDLAASTSAVHQDTSLKASSLTEGKSAEAGTRAGGFLISSKESSVTTTEEARPACAQQ
ncbi:Kinesin-like protein, partial [Globisporangium splendens]